MPTSSSFGTRPGAVFARICSRTPGAILQPQPPPWLNCVSFTCMSMAIPRVSFPQFYPPALREQAADKVAHGARFPRGPEENLARTRGAFELLQRSRIFAEPLQPFREGKCIAH